MTDRPSPLARALLVILMVVGVLGFGAVGLCGGYFAAIIAPALVTPGGSGMALLLVVPLTFAMAGLLMVRLCIEEIQHLLRRKPNKKDST